MKTAQRGTRPHRGRVSLRPAGARPHQRTKLRFTQNSTVFLKFLPRRLPEMQGRCRPASEHRSSPSFSLLAVGLRGYEMIYLSARADDLAHGVAADPIFCTADDTARRGRLAEYRLARRRAPAAASFVCQSQVWRGFGGTPWDR